MILKGFNTFGFPFSEVLCKSWYMLFCTLRHYEYNARTTLLFVITVSDWMAAVCFTEDMQEHVQTQSEKSCHNVMWGTIEINSVQILPDQTL